MNNNGIRKNLTLLFAFLFAAVISVWALFYTVVSYYISADAEKRTSLAANQIMNELSHALADMESVSFTLSRDKTVENFTVEKDLSSYYSLADQIGVLLAGSRYNPTFADHVIICNEEGSFYRFSGTLSNTSCIRVGYLADTLELPAHMVARFENTNYIGYVSGIYNTLGTKTGVIIMLVEENIILELIDSLVPDSTLLVAVTADQEIVVANCEDFSQIQEKSGAVFASRHIGLTPFAITVAVDYKSLNASTHYFTIATVLTAVTFGVLVFLFVRILSRRFFSPMLRVMHSVETLEERGDNQIPDVQSAEFDSLIGKINDMLLRLDRKNKEVQTAELRAKNAEIQKQKAAIFALKKQINAHFTINALNAIQILLENNDAEKAGAIITGLSSLIRYAYDKSELIDIWDEFQTLDSYITIMNIRYESRIKWDFDLDDRLMRYAMPRMLLQPIAENAILHGMKDWDGELFILIKAKLNNDTIMISIQDNGQGMSASSLDSLLEKLNSTVEDTPDGIENIALANIKKRLRSYYGGVCSFNIQSAVGKGTAVTLEFSAKAAQ